MAKKNQEKINKQEAKLLGKPSEKQEKVKEARESYFSEKYTYSITNNKLNNAETIFSGNVACHLISKSGKNAIKNGETSITDGDYTIRRLN